MDPTFQLDSIDSTMQADVIAAALHSDGWCVHPNFFDATTTTTLLADCLRQRSVFTAAAVGRAGARQQLFEQRRDSTLWLHADTPVQSDFLRAMEVLRVQLNRHLYLGLFDYEAHYAHYAPDAFYRRHRDAFTAQAATEAAPKRSVSSVFYLNSSAPGGELLLWHDDKPLAQIEPIAGTAVFFLSAEFPHEVLPTQADRYSIAGWFRGR
jgi:SM-20-related protein